MKRKQFLLWALAITAVLTACATAASPPTPPAMSQPTAAPALAPSTATPLAGATALAPTAVSPAAPPQDTPAAAEVTPAASPPAGQAPAWSEREPFRAGLIPSAQDALAAQPGATFYDLALDITDPALVRGTMAALYTNQESAPLDELVLHLFPPLLGGAISVENIRLDGEAVAAEAVGHLLRVPLPAPLAPGEQVVLELDFSTAVPGADEGTKYNVLAHVDGTLALAHFYPMFAVYDDAGWHTEPTAPHGDETHADSSFYRVQITAPTGQTVVTSGVAVDRQVTGDTQQITVVAGPMRDFYLAANADYTVVSEAVGPVRVNSYAQAGREEGAALALQTAVAALESYNKRFGPYPFRELDIVTTPTRALGIEYPGIFANAERLYDLDGTTSGLPNAVILESTTAHETAHQWFYSLIGNDQLNEPWLDESLTQYATYLYYVDRYGAQNAAGFLGSLEGRWAGAEDRDLPIGLPAEAYSGRDYGAIVYGRGPFFALALEEVMGAETFAQFLRDYNEQYRYEIATAADFRALAESACACDLSALFAAWVYAD